MASIEININPKVLPVVEFNGYIPTAHNVTYPILIQCFDGNAKVYFSPTSMAWLMPTDASALLDKLNMHQEIPPAPNVGFSEGFILRALAIAQDPKLAKELV